MNFDTSKMNKKQLEMHIFVLERAAENARKELAARPDEDVLVYGVPRFYYDTPGSGRTRYHLFRTAVEAYDNAHRIRVLDNPLYDPAQHEDDYQSRHMVETFYMHKDWKFEDER